MIDYFIKQAEKGRVPDFLIKVGIRNLCSQRLKWIDKMGKDNLNAHNKKWVEKLSHTRWHGPTKNHTIYISISK